jgi:hypothetical protein
MKTKTNITNSKATTAKTEGLGSESDRQFLPGSSANSRTADRPVIDWNKRNQNRNLPTRQLLDLMQATAPALYAIAQIVGKWVWVQFPDRQAPEVTAVLAQLGFHWNNKRQVWQHPCGPVTVDASPDDPRTKYGAEPARNLQPA